MGAASAAALVLSVGLLWPRRIDTAMRICALQALVAVLPLAMKTPAVAGLAFVLNGIAMPLVMVRTGGTLTPDESKHPMPVCGLAIAFVVVIIAVFARMGAGGTVTAGAAIVLLGLLPGALGRHSSAPVGMLSAQNGLVLAASAAPDMSLAAAVPLTPALVLCEAWLRR
jgi:hypothetical protein